MRTAFYQKILMCRSRILNIYLQLRKKNWIIIYNHIMHIWWCCYDLRYFFYARHEWLPTNLYKVHRYFFLSWCDLQNHIMYIYFFLHCRIRLPVDYWRHVMDRFVCKNMLIIVCCLLTLANRKKDFLLTFTGYLLRVLAQHIKTNFLKSFFCT